VFLHRRRPDVPDSLPAGLLVEKHSREHLAILQLESIGMDQKTMIWAVKNLQVGIKTGLTGSTKFLVLDSFNHKIRLVSRLH
jgi:hypothetical protein